MTLKNVFTRMLAIIAGTALFVGAFVVSIFLFALLLALGVVFAGYFLWKTRHVRRQMRQRDAAHDVIEGTVISSREIHPPESIER